MQRTGNKQYDNEPLNGAAAVFAGLLGHRLLDNQADRDRALSIAHHGAEFLSAARRVRKGSRALPEYYKHDVWFTVPMGLAFLELYSATNNQHWLDEAIRYAETLKKTQLNSGTWTWVDEESDAVGTANHRNDRSWDNLPLHCADYLYFFGQLRASGIDTYADVEQRAAQWMATATLNPPVHQGRAYLWHDRRPGDSLEAPDQPGTCCTLPSMSRLWIQAWSPPSTPTSPSTICSAMASVG